MGLLGYRRLGKDIHGHSTPEKDTVKRIWLVLQLAVALNLPVTLGLAQTLSPTPLAPIAPASVLGPAARFETSRTIASPDLPDLAQIDRDQDSWIGGDISGWGRYEAWRRIPLETLELQNNTITIADTVWWYIDDGSLAQCGWDDEPAREVYLRIVTSIDLGTDWKIHSASVADSPVVRNRCLLTGANFDATDLALQKVNTLLQKATQVMDSKIADQVDVAKSAAIEWSLLAGPQQPGSDSYVILAQAAAASKPSLTNSNLTTTILFEAATVKVKEATLAVPLPKLLVEGISQTYRINGDFLVPNEMFEKRIIPSSSMFNLQVPGARKRLVVNSAKVYEVQNQVGLRLGFDVTAERGRITPIVDAVTLFRRGFEAIRFRFDKSFYRLSGSLFVLGDPALHSTEHAISVGTLRFTEPTLLACRKTRRARWIPTSTLLDQAERLLSVSTVTQEEESKKNIAKSSPLGVTNEVLTNRPLSAQPIGTDTVDGGLAVTLTINGELTVSSSNP